MTLQVIHADSVPPQPWRNRGGYTRELFAWPSAAEPMLRVSLAEIETAGPFSTFSGMQRWFKVIEGAGVELCFADGPKRIGPDDPPLQFDGAAAPRCRLLKGSTRDLNLMYRADGTGAMLDIDDGKTWHAGSAQCGMFAAASGTWYCADGRYVDLPAQSLLWLIPGPVECMKFSAHRAVPRTAGWWLTFTPAK